MLAMENSANPRLPAAPIRDLGGGFHEIRFFALGSQCQLFYHADSPQAAAAYRGAATRWLTGFESRCSRFLPESELSRINANAGVDWVEIDPMTEVLLDLCAHSHFITQGAFDATSLPLTLLWDWRRKRDSLPSGAEIAEAKKRIGWSKLQRAPGRLLLPEKGMMIDFGGVGKEFAVDCLRQLAVEHGIRQAMIDLGGDIAVLGDSPEGGGWYVGLENPADPAHCFMGIRLAPGTAVATSGDYRRCFEFQGRTYGHILDCRTGWPVANGTRAVTVIAPRCVAAGLFSTSAMIIGGEEAIAMLDSTLGLHGCLWSHGQLLETHEFRRSVLAEEQQEN